MRRSEKEMKDPAEIEAVLQAALVCRIAMAVGDVPYVVPVHFAVSAGCLYFHCAASGRKIDMLHINPTVCFEVDMPGDLVSGKTACSWGMKYRSVIGFGQAAFIEHASEKKQALDILMKKYAGDDNFSYDDDWLDKVCVIGVRIDKITGKRSA
jgi:nitroimidazol reductase NimA-like FMN-containing flavoprotein (pyridoxamine 5'-phosphate oxidase superfamily)